MPKHVTYFQAPADRRGLLNGGLDILAFDESAADCELAGRPERRGDLVALAQATANATPRRRDPA